MFYFALFGRVVLCSVSELCLSQEHVNALFPRIQEKKSIVVENFLIWGFKTHHMLRRGSGALYHNRKIYVEEETIHPEGQHFTYTLQCQRTFSGHLAVYDRRRRVFKELDREREATFFYFF